MKEDFTILIESFHLPDKGETHNALELSPDKLLQREIVKVDIANDQILDSDYDVSEDPTRFCSETGRGPLRGNWIANVSEVRDRSPQISSWT